VALGRREQAGDALKQVRPTLRRLALKPALAETDALLDQVTARSA
jgi:hypothetical protein